MKRRSARTGKPEVRNCQPLLDMQVESLESRILLAGVDSLDTLFPTSDNADPFTFQGESVAISDQYYVTGKPLADKAADESGNVEVFDAITNEHVVTIDNPNATNSLEWFGERDALAIEGNIVVVGAPGKESTSFTDGEVHIFEITGGNANLLSSVGGRDTNNGDRFGDDVAIQGDIVVVASPDEDINGVRNIGAVYVYDISNGTPSVVTIIENPDPEENDQFGTNIAFDGTTIVIGERGGFSTGDTATLYAYDLDAAAGTATLLDSIANPVTNRQDFFTFGLEIDGSTIVASSPSGSLRSAGRVYQFSLDNNELALEATILRENNGALTTFGTSVALVGDTLYVGEASTFSSSLDAEGFVHVYDLSGTSPVLINSIASPFTDDPDSFGSRVAASGSKILVGSPRSSVSNSVSGGAYLFASSAESVGEFWFG